MISQSLHWLQRIKWDNYSKQIPTASHPFSCRITPSGHHLLTTECTQCVSPGAYKPEGWVADGIHGSWATLSIWSCPSASPVHPLFSRTWSTSFSVTCWSTFSMSGRCSNIYWRTGFLFVIIHYLWVFLVLLMSVGKWGRAGAGNDWLAGSGDP